jgi:hypothetical protein
MCSRFGGRGEAYFLEPKPTWTHFFERGTRNQTSQKCNHRSVRACSRNESKPDVCGISLLMHPVNANRFRSYSPQRSGAQCQLHRSDVDKCVSCVPTCSKCFSHARHCGEAQCRHARPQAPKRGGEGVCQNGHNLQTHRDAATIVSGSLLALHGLATLTTLPPCVRRRSCIA